MKVVHFISTFEMYNKEKHGVKNNTIRGKEAYTKVRGATHICIHKGYTKESFTRPISDVTLWGENTIISWRDDTGFLNQAMRTLVLGSAVLSFLVAMETIRTGNYIAGVLYFGLMLGIVYVGTGTR